MAAGHTSTAHLVALYSAIDGMGISPATLDMSATCRPHTMQDVVSIRKANE
jgi:hypothetical protein